MQKKKYIEILFEIMKRFAFILLAGKFGDIILLFIFAF